jgi:hypothetical protein
MKMGCESAASAFETCSWWLLALFLPDESIGNVCIEEITKCILNDKAQLCYYFIITAMGGVSCNAS